MKKIASFLIPLAFILFLVTCVHAQTEITGKVVSIADGDTITVLQNRTQYKIRLYGIDTPESRQDFGTKAKQFTSGLVFGKHVRVIEKDRDRYGRVVGLVYVGNTCVNKEIVKNGYAWVYRKYCNESICADWLKLEAQARSTKIGLWSHPRPIPPWEYRRGKRASSSTGRRPQEVSTGYHGNVKSGVFHRPGCRYYNCKNCTATFGSRAEAVSAGYRPCEMCRP